MHRSRFQLLITIVKILSTINSFNGRQRISCSPFSMIENTSLVPFSSGLFVVVKLGALEVKMQHCFYTLFLFDSSMFHVPVPRSQPRSQGERPWERGRREARSRELNKHVVISDHLRFAAPKEESLLRR